MSNEEPKDSLKDQGFDHRQEYMNQQRLAKKVGPAKPKCRYSNTQPSQEIMYKEVQHAGILTHRCSLDEGHEGWCKCSDPCNFSWPGWGNQNREVIRSKEQK